MNAIAPSLTGNPADLGLFGAVFAVFLLAGVALDVALFVRVRQASPLLFWLRLDAIRARPWKTVDAFSVFLLFLALNLCMSLTLSAIRRFIGLPAGRLDHVILVLQMLGVPLAAVAVAVSVMRRRNWSWRDAFGLHAHRWPQQVLRGVVYYVAAIPVVLAASLAYLGALVRIGYPVESQDVIRLLADPSQPLWLQIYIALLAVTLAPFAEELLFRGIILPGLLKHASPWRAMVLASLLFALLHLHVPSVVPLFMLAMAFSLAYVESGSLLVPMVMHAIFNGVSLGALVALRDILPLTAAP